MKILNTAPLPGVLFREGIKARTRQDDVTIVDAHRSAEDFLAAHVVDADILLGDYTGATPVTRVIAQAAGKLKLIQQPSVGYNHIDMEACRDYGIPVANTPGANDIGVAEHTIMLALACLKKLTYVNAATHTGEWLFDRRREIGIFEINGKTYGLLGMGRTARAVAERLLAFGVKLLYYDIVRLTAEEEKKYEAAYACFEELLKSADVVSIHLPLTPATKGIIDASALALMKPTAVLINVSRGPLVDENALAAALRSKKLAMAAADVYGQEPPPADHPFFGLPNIILTPHLAGSTLESGTRIINMVLDNIGRILRGEKPLWLINS